MQRNDASGFAPSRTTTSQQTTGTTNTLKHTAMGRLLLMALLLFAFLGGTRAQETLTVYDGTDTNSRIPFYGLYADYGTCSQFIIPADELVVMEGGTITALTFYSSNTSLDYDEGVTVYLKEVGYTTFPSDFMEDWSTMTAVYTGTIGVNSEGLMEIAFTTPYLYEGGNLMIGFQVTTWGESCPSVNWYGVNQASDSYTAVNNNANISHEWYSFTSLVNFIPKTTFIYEPDPNTCIKPHQLTISDITVHEATITWTSDADAWQIQLNEEDIIDVTDKTYTFTGLDPETTYSVKVRTNCDGNYSNWTIPVSFTTDILFHAPTDLAVSDITGHTATISWTGSADSYEMEYGIIETYDFEDGTLQGWTNLIVNADGGQWLHSNENKGGYDYTGLAHGGTGFAMCYSYIDNDGAYDTDAYLVSPHPYQICEGASLNFWYDMANYNYPENFEVCVATTANPTASDFTSIWSSSNAKGNGGEKAKVRRSNTRSGNWREVTLDLSAYAGQSVWIAFHDVNNDKYEVWVDDITVNANTAWIPVEETISDTQYTLSGLTPETPYMVRVRAIYDGDDGGESKWTSKIFTTAIACYAPTNVTISEIGPRSAVVSWESDNNLFNLMLGEELIEGVTNPYTLTSLTPETQYTVQVQSVCGGEDGESRWTDAKSFTTLALPVPADVAVSNIALTSATVSWTGYGDSYNVKYRRPEVTVLSEGFENGIEQWTRKDCPEETTRAETDGNIIIHHSGSYGFKFVGNGSTQYLISPELTGVTEGMKLEFYYKSRVNVDTYLQIGFSSTTTGDNAFTYGNDMSVSSTSWQLYSIAIPEGTKYICWSAFGRGTNYNLHIDDIRVGRFDDWTTVTTNEPSVTLTGLTPETTYECQVQSVVAGHYSDWTPLTNFTTLESIPMPTDVAVSTTPTTATISWTDNGNSNSYNVDYRDPEAIGNIVLSQDFEGGLNGWTRSGCGSNSNVDGALPHNGSKAFRFCYLSYGSTMTTPQYLISPELTGVTEGTKLEFWYKNSDTKDEKFHVGFSTTGIATEDFNFGNEISAGGKQWRHYKETIPEGTKYICLKYTSNNNNLAIDDILIYQNATEWTSISATELPVTITGLTPSTTYEYRAQNVLYGDPSDWTEVATFTTMVENPVPVDLAADNITSATADISWTGYGDSYNVRYRRADHVGDEILTEGFESGLNGWTRRNYANNSDVGTHFPHSGSQAFRFCYLNYTTTMTTPQYLISPELTGVTEGTKLEFWYKNTDTKDETFHVGFSTTGNATDNFNFGNEVSAGGQQWRHYSATIPAGTKYVCLKYTSNRNNLAIDDILIYAEAAWMTAVSDELAVTIDGMDPETAYEWQVQSVKNGAASGWSELATFTTSPLVELVNDDSGFESGAKNSDVISANNNSKVDVKLADRTLYKDGEWNTICLPFNVTLADSPLEGAIAKTLYDATMTGTHVTLTFSDAVTELEAGVPYIIKWDVSEDALASDIVNPVFNGVTIVANTEDQHTISAAEGQVKFIGYYDAFGIDTPANDDIYYMTSGSTLKHTGKARTLKACRAYFQFSEAANGRLLVLNFGDGETTGIISIENGKLNNESGWYTVDGKKLDQQPTRKGLYIHNGVKVVIK